MPLIGPVGRTAPFTNLLTNPSVETDLWGWTLGAGTFNDLTTISGLQAWWKADALGLTDGTAVSSWTDSSGNSRPLLQATGSSQPIYKTNQLNSQPILRFDKVDDFMAASFTLSEPIHVFIVAKYNQAFSANDTMLDGTTVNSARILRTDATHVGQLNVTGPATTPESFHIWSSTFVGSASNETRVDGGTAVTGNPSLPSSKGGISVNRPGGFAGQYGGIDVAEIVVFNAALSTANRQLVEGYLAQKYNISGPAAPAAGATLTQSSAWSSAGTKSARLQVTPGYTGVTVDTPSFLVTASASYSGSLAYNAGTVTGGSVVVSAHYSDGSSTAMGTISAAGAGTITSTALTAAGTAATLRAAPNAAGTFDVSFDAGLVVAGTVLPTYFDGDTPGYAWTGTSGASTSASALEAPAMMPRSPAAIRASVR